MKLRQYILLSACLMGLIVELQAQNDTTTILQKDVEVVNTYLPTIGNPRKLQVAPLMDDTMSYHPAFRYRSIGKVEHVQTMPDSISAAAMRFVRDESPYKSLLRFGGGNYATFGGELFYNIGVSSKYHLSLNGGHRSTFGKVELPNDSGKVKAPLSRTWLAADFARMFKRVVVGMKMNYNNDIFKYYGMQTIYADSTYTTTTGENALGNELTDGQHQRTSAFDFDFTIGNTMRDHRSYNRFDVNVGFGLFGNTTDLHETDIRVGAMIYMPLKKNYFFSSRVDVNNFSIKSPSYEGPAYTFSDRKHTDVMVRPRVGVDFDHVNLRLGLKLIFEVGDNKDDMFLMPDIWADFKFAEDIFTFYAGMTGDYASNSYRSLYARNRYVSADAFNYVWRASKKVFVSDIFANGYNIPTTQTPIKFTAGFNSTFSKKVALNAQIEYGSFDDELFFVNKGFEQQTANANDTVFGYTNRFGVVAENGKLFKATGELIIKPTSKSNILLTAEYYKYRLDYLSKPWYKPQYDISLTSRFFPTDRLLIDAQLRLVGERYAFDQTLRAEKELDKVIDLNIGAEYYITSRWTAYLRLNNLAAQDWEQWLGYTTQKVNFTLGATFKF
ncbi:MAG: hypothetical protein E7069_00940 [Bacteroidales bacterium]|nr:hypothetical protein [Bacteroidales bacterium]